MAERTVLAFDTCLGACSVAVRAGPALLSHRFEERARGHAEALLPMIESALAQARLTLSEIEVLAVTVGPGTFTGCRLGVAAARGLALVHNVPADGRTTLACLAAAAVQRDPARVARTGVMALIDARRGQLYGQRFTAAAGDLAGLRAQETPLLFDLGAPLPGARGDELLCGSGADLYRASVPACRGAVAGPGQPDAAALAALVAAQPEAGDAKDLKPLYLRPPDAKAPAPPPWKGAGR